MIILLVQSWRIRDKITGEAEAIHDKIAEEVAELLVEQPIEAIIEAVERVDEEANEIIVIDSSTEAIIDKFAGDKAINDNTIDPSIELAVLEAVDRVSEEANEIIVIDSITETIIDKIAEEVAEFLVEQPIEAIQAAERIDKEAEGPRFESKLH